MMPEIDFDRYYRYDELSEVLHAFAAEYRDLVQLESLGPSYEGRDIWLAKVTNAATAQISNVPGAMKPIKHFQHLLAHQLSGNRVLITGNDGRLHDLHVLSLKMLQSILVYLVSRAKSR